MTDRQIIQIAQEVCLKNLKIGSCSDYKVTVSSAVKMAGDAPVLSTYTSEGSRVRAIGVRFSPRLRNLGPEATYFVAAHEWNHVKQAILAKTPQRYSAFQERANAYFAPRAKVRLKGTTGGMELLTDCMTVFGDGVPLGVGQPVTPYVRGFLTSTTMKAACGPKWQSLLPK